jgi:hypothetical protein
VNGMLVSRLTTITPSERENATLSSSSPSRHRRSAPPLDPSSERNSASSVRPSLRRSPRHPRIRRRTCCTASAQPPPWNCPIRRLGTLGAAPR